MVSASIKFGVRHLFLMVKVTVMVRECIMSMSAIKEIEGQVMILCLIFMGIHHNK